MTPNSSPSYSFLEHVPSPAPSPPLSYLTSTEYLSSTEDSHHVPTPSSTHTNSTNFSPNGPSFDNVSSSNTLPVSPTQSHHPILTREKRGIVKPIHKLNLHVDSPSLVPKNYLHAFKDPN